VFDQVDAFVNLGYNGGTLNITTGLGCLPNTCKMTGEINYKWLPIAGQK
jgi:hypothetical protein